MLTRLICKNNNCPIATGSVCVWGGCRYIFDYSDNNKTILTEPALYGFLLWKDYRFKIITTYRESEKHEKYDPIFFLLKTHLKLDDKVKYGL